MLTVLLTNDFNAQTSKLSIVSKGQLFKLILQGFTQDSILSMVPGKEKSNEIFVTVEKRKDLCYTEVNKFYRRGIWSLEKN